MRSIGMKAWKISCGFIIFLLITELLLRLLSYVYLSVHFNRPKIGVENTNNAITILYIGDSWTQGADAPQGKGYVDILLNMLKEEFPNMKIQQVNLGHGSFNSAEACIEFMQNYKEINPHILIVLFGMNNGWNTNDVDLAEKYFEREMHGLKHSTITPVDILLSKLMKLKIFKLLRIACANLTIRINKFEGPHPMDSYVGPYFTLHSQGRLEEGREYLINNCDDPSKYNNLYRTFLYSFNYDRNAIEAYLKKRNFWHPEWVKYTYDKRKREKYINLKIVLLKKHIAFLSSICKKEHIKLIIQTYPFFNNEWCDCLNEAIRTAAYDNELYLVDHASLFKKDLGDNYQMYQTFFHVNAEGYSKMAKNFFKFFIKEKLLNKIE